MTRKPHAFYSWDEWLSDKKFSEAALPTVYVTNVPLTGTTHTPPAHLIDATDNNATQCATMLRQIRAREQSATRG